MRVRFVIKNTHTRIFYTIYKRCDIVSDCPYCEEKDEYIKDLEEENENSMEYIRLLIARMKNDYD